ncbi:MAG: hypothetical protein HUU37_00105 [Bdellovibrionales bacterium]|nr:hypothetical protein [Bdellovibrionales bacterium]
MIFLSVFFAANAWSSDWYYDYKDGKRYVCTFDKLEGCQRDSDCSGDEICRSGQCEANPVGAIRCAEKAYKGPFSREQSAELCQGASDTDPADCGIAAYKGPFSTTEAIVLCKNAPNAEGPASCGIKAYRGPFSSGESVQLCRGAASDAPAVCAIEAYRGPYSKEEALRMCSSRGQSASVQNIMEHLKTVKKADWGFLKFK